MASENPSVLGYQSRRFKFDARDAIYSVELRPVSPAGQILLIFAALIGIGLFITAIVQAILQGYFEWDAIAYEIIVSAIAVIVISRISYFIVLELRRVNRQMSMNVRISLTDRDLLLQDPMSRHPIDLKIPRYEIRSIGVWLMGVTPGLKPIYLVNVRSKQHWIHNTCIRFVGESFGEGKAIQNDLRRLLRDEQNACGH
jgi:hypothetical protein